MRGTLLIVSAPSGVGKTTLIRRALTGEDSALEGVRFSVSHTTRAARSDEVDGRDYHFVDESVFRSMLERDEFLEWADVYGQLKGTSRNAVLPLLERGFDVILDIDVQGAAQVLQSYSEAESVLILPPSFAELERRIRERGGDPPDQLARRLALSLPAIERYEMYGYVMINDDLIRAQETLRAILIAIRHRRERQSECVAEILEDFRSSLGKAGTEGF
ncbi:MAG: guanylate kinase [bacterium]|nr:guanylate kinase [bacterium]